MRTPDPFARLRNKMVTEQIESRRIKNRELLQAMRSIPRHLFVPKKYQQNAYEDRPILIGKRQTISQPYIVALMTELLHLCGEEVVLEVGTGSGYQAAVLAALVQHVYTVERHPELARRAAHTLEALEINNVTVLEGDGSRGWPEFAPYDAIMVTAAAPNVPNPLLEQLALGGRLVLPVGEMGKQYLQVWTRNENGFQQDDLVPVSFVPLLGEFGFDEGSYPT